MKNVIVTIIFIVQSLIGLCQTDSIVKKQPIKIFLNAGYFISFSYLSMTPFAGNAGLNLSIKGKHFFQLRAYSLDNLSNWNTNNKIRGNVLFHQNSGCLMYGYGEKNEDNKYLIMSIGISYVEGKYIGEKTIDKNSYEIDNYKTIGVPIIISISKFNSLLGWSIEFLANIHKHPDFGIALNINIGKLK